MSIASKLQTIYTGIEDVRDALQDIDPSLGRGTIGTLGDDVRTLMSGGSGYGFKVYGDVRSEEEVEVEDPETGETTTETEYTYTNSLILDSILAAKGDDLNTDVIDGIGELDGDMVNLAGGKVQIPLKGGLKITVDPAKVYVKFRDPLVENIVMTNWGTDGKITLSAVRAITSLSTYFIGTAIETFNEFKWFDGLVYSPGTGANGGDAPYPFKNCTSLREIKLPRVHSLGNGAFCNCSSLTSIIIPNSFTDLGKGYSYSNPYFKNTQIEELVIPASVTETSMDCFSNMPNLKKIVWGDNLPFPRYWSANATNPYAYIKSCPNLEKIENITTINASGCNVNFNGTGKLDYTNILPLIAQYQNCIEGWGLSHEFEGTKIFDYAPNGIITFTNIPNGNGSEYAYLFNSDSEAGFTLRFPNWTEGISLSYSNRFGRIEFGENVTSMHYRFWNNTNVSECILPCTTPPTLTSYTAMPAQLRVFVPASAMSDYLADEIWGQHASHLKPIEDPTLFQFCSIPNAASIPDGYTKVEYISNINGDDNKNCQISNIEYKPQQYSQYLFDFSHKFSHTVSDSNGALMYTNDGNYRDFLITINNADSYPALFRGTSTNANYPNRMGITLSQRWFFNSKVTGEEFGKRSILKISNKWVEYHGVRHRVDENTGNSNANLALLRYNNNDTLGRQVKIYRFCIFEPIENCNDYDDPTQYEIVRDYVPVMRNSDGVYGLYERLTENFYPSTIAAAPFSGPAYE